MVRENREETQVITGVLVDADLDIDDDPDETVLEDHRHRKHRLVALAGSRDMNRFWMALGIAD